MNNTLYQWLGGLISASTGAVGAAIGVMVVDPLDFNFQAGIGKLATVSVISATVAVLNYLAKSPLPGWSSTTIATETKSPNSSKTVTTISVAPGVAPMPAPPALPPEAKQ